MIQIKTKWGRISINPENIYEMHVVLNPWADMYKVTFIMDEDYQQIEAELENSTELLNTIRQITSHTDFIKQYKYIDRSGRVRIDEPRRLSLMRQSEDD